MNLENRDVVAEWLRRQTRISGQSVTFGCAGSSPVNVDIVLDLLRGSKISFWFVSANGFQTDVRGADLRPQTSRTTADIATMHAGTAVRPLSYYNLKRMNLPFSRNAPSLVRVLVDSTHVQGADL